MTNGIIPGLVLPKHEFYNDPFIMTCHGLQYCTFFPVTPFLVLMWWKASLLLLLFPFASISLVLHRKCSSHRAT